MQALDLSRSQDLLCHNLVCEKVGQPCICRLAQVLERHAGSLRWLSLSGNALEQLPEALTGLPCLRYLDLSGNRLSALPQGFTNLRSLQVRCSGFPLWLQVSVLKQCRISPTCATSRCAPCLSGFPFWLWVFVLEQGRPLPTSAISRCAPRLCGFPLWL